MKSNNSNKIVERSIALRQKYHELELKYHGTEWSVEEDALAFLTDASLVGRHTMSQQGRWPANDTEAELEHKLGECVWWLIILAHRMNIDIEEAIEKFLTKTEQLIQ